ncbi:hypothetical protein [Nocardioides daphniae]|uniref:Peptidyl-prolyl cis-trans isomerase n=1 Tax=Nocardioides daphniae TaxID=402297 RepID=A0A4P7UBA0_9ACTN|nr:hypothetical protein [Nocardioides daphniae]QCC76575.1 hypothetical protein E2C04_03930 [Nocardioides daphniae]GGD14217.1 hypothetical protein GCM10007231_11490 [Nocardioides daphniae]
MTQPRLRRHLVTGLAAVSMLGLTGCGGAVTTTTTGPGTAAQIGDVTITQATLDDTTDAICADLTPQLQQDGPVALMQVKQYALNLLTARAQAEQLAEEYDVEPGPEVAQDLAQWKAQSERVPERLRDEFAAAMNTEALVNSVLDGAGTAALARDGVRNPTQEQVQQRGSDLFATWSDTVDVTIDPRYGAVVEEGLLQPARTSLSVPVSAQAVKAWAQVNDRENASPDFVETLPESQRCG